MNNPTFREASEWAWIRYTTATRIEGQEQQEAFRETVEALLEEFEKRLIEFYKGKKPS